MGHDHPFLSSELYPDIFVLSRDWMVASELPIVVRRPHGGHLEEKGDWDVPTGQGMVFVYLLAHGSIAGIAASILVWVWNCAQDHGNVEGGRDEIERKKQFATFMTMEADRAPWITGHGATAWLREVHPP